MGVVPPVRWYVNDASLQGQFQETTSFEDLLRNLTSARARIDALRRGLYTTRTFSERHVKPGLTLRETIRGCRERDLRAAVMVWLDRTGPYVDDDRIPEDDDYFECFDRDITD